MVSWFLLGSHFVTAWFEMILRLALVRGGCNEQSPENRALLNTAGLGCLAPEIDLSAKRVRENQDETSSSDLPLVSTPITITIRAAAANDKAPSVNTPV